MPTLSVLMITLNADHLLERVFESIAWADEIVVVDSGSTDRTREIAERYTDKFYELPYEGHGVMRQQAFRRSSGDWILYVDADEVVTPALRDSIRQAVAFPGDKSGFRMELLTWFMGQWFGTKGWRKEWKLRLFRRDAGSFDSRPVHEGAAVEGKIGTLQGVIEHYPYRDAEHAIRKLDGYARQGAALLAAKGHRPTPIAGALRGGWRFLRDYVMGGDILYGRAGLARSRLMARYTYRKYALGAAAPAGGAAGEPDR